MLTARVLLAPHVPTLLVDEHRGHRTEMIRAYQAAAWAFAAEAPDAVVVLSARWEAPGPFLAGAERRHATITDYYGFGVEVRYDCRGEPGLARALVAAAQQRGVRAATSDRGVDSGVTVPMHFLAPDHALPIVPVSLARGTREAHRAWGAALRGALDAWPGRIAFVAGGMLSHNLHAWNLRREIPETRAFDARVIEALGAGGWSAIAEAAARAPEPAAPEAGLLHLEVLRGLLGADLAGTVRCYEPGPGVGAALVEFLVGEPRPLPPQPEAELTGRRKGDPRLHVPPRGGRNAGRPEPPPRRGAVGKRGPAGKRGPSRPGGRDRNNPG